MYHIIKKSTGREFTRVIDGSSISKFTRFAGGNGNAFATSVSWCGCTVQFCLMGQRHAAVVLAVRFSVSTWTVARRCLPSVVLCCASIATSVYDFCEDDTALRKQTTSQGSEIASVEICWMHAGHPWPHSTGNLQPECCVYVVNFLAPYCIVVQHS